MGPVVQLIFPAAMLGSLILATFTMKLTESVSWPAALIAEVKMNNSNENGDQGGNNDLATDSLNGKGDKYQENGKEKDESNDKDSEKCLVSGNYPNSIRQWCKLITEYSKKNNLDPDLIAALIWQESGGNSTAYSRSGAVGLMQVMPKDGIAATFQCKNGPCFANRPSIKELQDPDYNVKYGTGMLAGLVNKHGSVREALKYYGPMNVGYYYADKVLGIFKNYRD
jgi:hypothetical protein